MDLFVNLYKSSRFFNYNLLPKYTYYDLYTRSLNMTYRLKKINCSCVILFMPNCIEYIECIFASVMANVNSLHCSYENILKYILLPDIDLIITTKSNLDIINTLLYKCNENIANEIRSKMIIVEGHLTGENISTLSMLSNEDIMDIYKYFINNSTKYFIFPSNIYNNYSSNNHTTLPHQFLKASVQYIQYYSYYYKNRYRNNTTFTLFPYGLNTLNGIICLFNIINNWECIVDLDAKFRYGEEYFENYLLPFNDIHIQTYNNLVVLYINENELENYNMFYDKTTNSIKLCLNEDFYTTDYIGDAKTTQLVVNRGNFNSNPYSYVTIFGGNNSNDNVNKEIIIQDKISKIRYKISKKYILNNTNYYFRKVF
jgi:hypothetical protein